MNLKKSAFLAEIIGGVGIIVSILYLAFEVSENTKNTRLSNQLALIEQNAEINFLHMTNPDMVEVILKGSFDMTSLSAADQFRFESYTDQVFNFWASAMMMSENEVLPTGMWDVWNFAFCENMKKPGVRAVWDAGLSKTHRAQFRDNVSACFTN